MKEVVLIFPDVQSMADFIIKEKISNAEADSFEQTVIGAVSEDQIDIAKEVYGAMLKAVLSWVFISSRIPLKLIRGLSQYCCYIGADEKLLSATDNDPVIL